VNSQEQRGIAVYEPYCLYASHGEPVKLSLAAIHCLPLQLATDGWLLATALLLSPSGESFWQTKGRQHRNAPPLRTPQFVSLQASLPKGETCHRAASASKETGHWRLAT